MGKIDIDALFKEMENVPFGNSAFQNEHFTDGQETPERRYRHVMLQLHKKLPILKSCDYRRQRIAIDIEELAMKIRWAWGNKKRRLKIDLAETEWQLKAEEQLIKDAMVEVDTHRKMLQDLPKPTREEFEAGEPGYWRKRLVADAKNQIVAVGHVDPGTLKSLKQIGMVMAQTEQGQITFIEKDRIKLVEEAS